MNAQISHLFSKAGFAKFGGGLGNGLGGGLGGGLGDGLGNGET